jgi:hypothetical protein
MTVATMSLPVKNAANTRRGRPFGVGNGGRPKGSRNRRSVLVEALMADDVEAITKVVITKAKKGDLTACRIVLDRIAPPRKGRPISVVIPAVTDAKSVLDVHAEIMRAVAAGELTPDEAEPICSMLTARVKLIETVEIAARLEALERKAGLR